MTTMSLAVLGRSGSYPGRGQACSGYLVRSENCTVALDLGSGTLANLQRHIPLEALDAVVLTHQHPDHWVDLAGLRVALRYVLGREGLPVYGGPAVRSAAQSLCGALSPPFEWHEVHDGDVARVGDLELRFAATDHEVPTLAVRVDGAGRSLAYSADTGPGWSFASLGGGIDLALCEATYLAEDRPPDIGHLSAEQAGTMARAAGVGELVLTHLLPGVDPAAARAEAATALGRDVAVAAEGSTYSV